MKQMTVFALLAVLATSTVEAARIRVFLKTDLVPGSEVLSVVTNASPRSDPSTLFAEETLVGSGDDLLSGSFKIAEWTDAPSSVLHFRVLLFDAAGTFIAHHPGVLVSPSGGVTDVVILIGRGASPPYVGAPQPYWTEWRSEEPSPAPWLRCTPGYAADGIACHGRFCDNVRLHCKPLGGSAEFADLVGPFDEHSPHVGTCGEAGFVTDLICTQGFCGDLLISCDAVHGGVHLPDCYFSPLISDESSGIRQSSFVDTSRDNSHFLQSITCYGDNCDDKILTMCPRAYPVVEAFVDSIPMPEPLCTAELLPDGTQVIVCPLTSDDPEQNDSAHMFLDPDGNLRRFGTERCIGYDDVPELGADLTMLDCLEAPTWLYDAWGRLRLASDDQLCLGVRGAPRDMEADPSLALELQSCEEARFFLLPGADRRNLLHRLTLLLSEYLEGTGVDKALELYNVTSDDVKLDDFEIWIHEGKSSTQEPDRKIELQGLLQPGETFVIAREHPQADPNLLGLADLTHPDLVFEGGDTILLYQVSEGVAVDSFGQLGAFLPSFSDDEVSSVDVDLRRLPHVGFGDIDPMGPFGPSTEWEEFPAGDYTNLGLHEYEDPSVVFADGFESGDTSVWSPSSP